MVTSAPRSVRRMLMSWSMGDEMGAQNYKRVALCSPATTANTTRTARSSRRWANPRQGRASPGF
jgi:hypothetical protein